MARQHSDEGGGWVVGVPFSFDTNPETVAMHAAGVEPDPAQVVEESEKPGNHVTLDKFPAQSIEHMKDAGMIVPEGVWRRAKAIAKLTGGDPSEVISTCGAYRQAGDLMGKSWTVVLDVYEERHGVPKVEAGPGAMALNERVPDEVIEKPEVVEGTETPDAQALPGWLGGDKAKPSAHDEPEVQP